MLVNREELGPWWMLYLHSGSRTLTFTPSSLAGTQLGSESNSGKENATDRKTKRKH